MKTERLQKLVSIFLFMTGGIFLIPAMAQNTLSSVTQNQSNSNFSYFDASQPSGLYTEKGFIGVTINYSGTTYETNFALLNKITVSFTGTSIADLSGFKLYSYALHTGVNYIGTGTVTGNSIAFDANYNFLKPGWSGTGDYSYHFMVSAKVNGSATLGDIIDFQLIDYTIDNVQITSFSDAASMAYASTISQGLTGTKTVDNTQPTAGDNYNNFRDVSNVLGNLGAGAGGVTFLFKDDQTFPHNVDTTLSIPSYVAGPGRELVLKRSGDGTAKPNIYLKHDYTQGRGLVFNQCDYVTLDGFNFSNFGTTGKGAIWLNNTATDGFDNIAIVNNDFYMNNQNVASFCCDYAGVIVNNINSNYSLPFLTNSKFIGNTFHDFLVGIRFWDGGSGTYNTNNEYAYNTFTGFTLIGMQLMAHESTSIHHNIISNLFVNRDPSDSRDEPHGIFLEGNGNYKIYNNQIYSLTNTGSGVLTGIYAGQINAAYSTDIYNNIISDIKTPNTTQNIGVKVFELTNAGKYNFYYNTVYLNDASGNGKYSAIFKSDHGNNKYLLKNNIFINNSTSAPVTVFAEDWSGANAVNANSSNNIYYSSASSFAMFYNSGNSSVTIGTFSDYTTALGGEANSVFTSIPFVSETNLHLQGASAAVNGGVPVSGIATDFEGDTRSTTAPYIGADEVFVPLVSMSVTPQSNAITLNRGTVKVNVSTSPSNASNSDLTFSYSPNGIVQGMPDNYVMGIGNGIVTVTASSVENPSLKSAFVLTVTNQLTTPDITVSGYVLLERWDGIGGTAITDIPLSTPPSVVLTVTNINYQPNLDNYGTRIRGYIVPQNTGDYTFYVSSDDASQVWLSSSIHMADKSMIAYVNGATGIDNWTNNPSQRSQVITLEAEKRYYFEIFQKEGGGGDQLQLAWTGPGYSSITYVPSAVLDVFPPIGDMQSPSAPTTITSALAGQSFIDLTWSGAMDNFDIAYYLIFNGSTLVGSTPGNTFHFGSLAANTSYTIGIKSVDLSGNISTLNGVALSTTGTNTPSGFVYWEYFPGASALTNIASSTPSFSAKIYKTQGPVNYADGYGSRIRGFIIPDQTGMYDFSIATDDQAELWLSTNEDISNKVRIATNTYSPLNNFTDNSSQQSATLYTSGISLTAGTSYYFEVIHIEGGGGDHVQLAWKLNSENVSQYRVITSPNLSNYSAQNIVESAPAAPVVTATIVGDFFGVLNWPVPTGLFGVSSYSIIVNGVTTYDGGNVNSFTITGLVPNQNYTVQVLAYSSMGAPSALSNLVTLNNSGNSLVLMSDFTGTAPGANRPWSKNYIAKVLFSGWDYGPAISYYQADLYDNEFAFQLESGGVPTTLNDAIANDFYLKFTITVPGGASLNLNNKNVALNLVGQAVNYNIGLFSSIGGFASDASAIATYIPSGSSNNATFQFPSSGYDNLQGVIEFRLYLYNGQYFRKAALTAFAMSGIINDIQAPEAPVLTLDANTQQSASLSWNTPADNIGVVSYQVFKDGVITTTVGNTFTFTGLSASTAYQFKVTALDAGGNISAISNVLTVTTDGKYNQTITGFGSISNLTLDSYTITIAGVSGGPSGNPIVFTLITDQVSGVASVTGNVISLLGVGTVTVTASQIGNASYEDAAPVSQVFTISKASQTITGLATTEIAQIGDVLSLFTVSASSSLPVSFSSASPLVSINGVSLEIVVLGVGTATITGTQLGNDRYNAATDVTLILTINKLAQSITGFNSISTQTVGGDALSLNATASSGLPVTYSLITEPSTGVAVMTGNLLEIVGAGNVTVTASQIGDDNYMAAASVSQTFVIVAATTPIPLPIILSVTGTSHIIEEIGGTLQLNVNVSNGTVSGVTWTISDTTLASVSSTGLVTAKANGIITVTATSLDNPATLATYEISIETLPITGIKFGSQINVSVYPNPATDVLNISTLATIQNVKLFNLKGTLVFEGKTNSVQVGDLSKGLYLLQLTTDKGVSTQRISIE